MLDLDFAQLPTDMMQFLMSRGSGPLPLVWHEHQNALAKRRLDDIEDVQLFGGAARRSENLRAALRALLFLWTGWTDDANTVARIAPDRERLYITGLCARHWGRANEAKAAFRQMEEHAVFKPLAEYALKVIRPDAETALKRFREIVEQNKAWEPYAFVDLYEQARTNRLSPTAGQVVSGIQAKEFELLFGHCFTTLTGRSLIKQRAAYEVDEQRREQEYRRRMADRRKEAEKRTQRQAKERQSAQKKQAPEPPNLAPPPDSRAKILCPKCGQLLFVPESARGRAAKCLKCGVAFLVPHKKPEPAFQGLPVRK